MKKFGRKDILVIEALEELGGKASGNEIAKYLYENEYSNTYDNKTIHPRLHKLMELGFLKISGQKQDPDTGNMVNIYEQE